MSCQQACQMFRANSTGAFLSSAGLVSIGTPAKMNREGDVIPTGITSVDNPFGCSRTEAGPVCAVWDDSTDSYVLIAPFHFATVDIDVLAYQDSDDGPVDVDDSDQTLGYYLTQITVLAAGTEGSRQVYYTGTACP